MQDDQIRRLFPNDSHAVVEEVVRARREIWGGLSGRKCASDPDSSLKVELTG